MPNPVSNAFRADLIASLALAGLLLPEAVAYAGIAGLPPQAGILALLAGLLAYGLFGASRFAIVSPTSSAAAVLAAACAGISDPAMRAGFATAIVLACGALFILAGLARLGRLTDFIARPVLQGFGFGLALVIVCRQWADVVGLHLPAGNALQSGVYLLQHLLEWNVAAVLMALAAWCLIVAAQARGWPGALLASIGGIVCSFAPDFAASQIPLVGRIELALPQLSWPDLSPQAWGSAFELALAMLLILYAESYAAIRQAAILHGDRVQANRDLLALGAANLCAGLAHGLAVGAGFSATAANQSAGAQSRRAGLLSAAWLLLLLLLCLPLLARLPKPVLAAIVMHAVTRNLSLRQFAPYFAWKRDRLIAVAAVLAVLLLGVLHGLLLALGLSMLLLLQQIAKSTVVELGRLAHGHDFVELHQFPLAQAEPGFLILRPEEPLFFANAERIMHEARARVRAAGATLHTVVLSLEEAPDLDASSVQALHEFAHFLTQRGQRLAFARLKEHAWHVLARSRPLQQDLPRWASLSVDQALSQLKQDAP
ncbi:SulP family inorganic anion transporter [Massilia sp. W12]|uniref:SulP family inorganic anion transporter n=1 Tax=Massilia sp. W12 TaxID=3126507 RepID=UPI0030CCC4E0